MEVLAFFGIIIALAVFLQLLKSFDDKKELKKLTKDLKSLKKQGHKVISYSMNGLTESDTRDLYLKTNKGKSGAYTFHTLGGAFAAQQEVGSHFPKAPFKYSVV